MDRKEKLDKWRAARGQTKLLESHAQNPRSMKPVVKRPRSPREPDRPAKRYCPGKENRQSATKQPAVPKQGPDLSARKPVMKGKMVASRIDSRWSEQLIPKRVDRVKPLPRPAAPRLKPLPKQNSATRQTNPPVAAQETQEEMKQRLEAWRQQRRERLAARLYRGRPQQASAAVCGIIKNVSAQKLAKPGRARPTIAATGPAAHVIRLPSTHTGVRHPSSVTAARAASVEGMRTTDTPAKGVKLAGEAPQPQTSGSSTAGTKAVLAQPQAVGSSTAGTKPAVEAPQSLTPGSSTTDTKPAVETPQPQASGSTAGTKPAVEAAQSLTPGSSITDNKPAVDTPQSQGSVSTSFQHQKASTGRAALAPTLSKKKQPLIAKPVGRTKANLRRVTTGGLSNFRSPLPSSRRATIVLSRPAVAPTALRDRHGGPQDVKTRRSLTSLHRKKQNTQVTQLLDGTKTPPSFLENQRRSFCRKGADAVTPRPTRTVTWNVPNDDTPHKTPAKRLRKTPRKEASLQERLGVWLEKMGKTPTQYRHLCCYGVRAEELPETPSRRPYRDTRGRASSGVSVTDGAAKEAAQPEFDVDAALGELKELQNMGISNEMVVSWLERLRAGAGAQARAAYWVCQAKVVARERPSDPNKVLEVFSAAVDHDAEPITEIAAALKQYAQTLVQDQESESNIEAVEAKLPEDTAHANPPAKTPRKNGLQADNVFQSSAVQYAVFDNMALLLRLCHQLHVDPADIPVLRYVITPVRRSTRRRTTASALRSTLTVVDRVEELPRRLRKSALFTPNGVMGPAV